MKARHKREIAAIWGVFGILLISFGLYNVSIGNASRDWPTTSATISHSSVETFQTVRQNDTGTRVKTHYKLVARFEYTVEGQTYESDRYAEYGDMTSTSRLVIERALQKYEVGSEVLTYYDPENPDVGILEPGTRVSFSVLFVIGLGAVMLVLAVLLCVPEPLGRRFLPEGYYSP